PNLGKVQLLRKSNRRFTRSRAPPPPPKAPRRPSRFPSIHSDQASLVSSPTHHCLPYYAQYRHLSDIQPPSMPRTRPGPRLQLPPPNVSSHKKRTLFPD
ncbi:hypothetical protein K438DRAFT_1803956, partial [Mycena galopus ATCC 62051]